MSHHQDAASPQKDLQSVNGLLYTVESVKTDIRRTFRQKYGWVGPEEQRRLAEIQKGGDHANS